MEKLLALLKHAESNYTVVIDEDNSVGSRFNGGELPTTIIVDAQGNVRRRFIGSRSLPVFDAMIAEASQPLLSTQNKLALASTSSPEVENE